MTDFENYQIHITGSGVRKRCRNHSHIFHHVGLQELSLYDEHLPMLLEKSKKWLADNYKTVFCAKLVFVEVKHERGFTTQMHDAKRIEHDLMGVAI